MPRWRWRRRGRVHSGLGPVYLASGLLALLPVASSAQGSSVLIGTAHDAATHALVSDVLVTATSPSLQGEQTALTDASGNFRLPQLPPGTFTLRFEREGYRPLLREGVELPAGYTLRFNPELIPDTAGETTVAVIGRPPLVDVGSTQQGAIVDQDFIRTVPVVPPLAIGGNNRSFESVALVVPGTHADTYGVAINGTTSPENGYFIDGLSTRSADRGISGSQLSLEFVESVAVLTGGYLPEYGRTTGGIIEANTRSGGNEFHGSVWGTWTPGALTGTPHSVQVSRSFATFRPELMNTVDFGVSLGGPLVKDRLWFFVGIQPEFTRYRIVRELRPYEVDPEGNQVIGPDGRPVPGSTAYTDSRFADERQVQYFGKLTYLIATDHRVSLTVTGTPSRSGGQDAYAFSPLKPGIPVDAVMASPDSAFRQTFNGSFDTVGKLSSSFGEKRVLLDATVGWHHEDHDASARDGSKLGSTDPAAVMNQPSVQWASRALTEFESLPPALVADCEADGQGGRSRCPTVYTTGGPSLTDLRIDSVQGRATVTLLLEGLGHHVVKAGFDGEYAVLDRTFGRSGSAILFENATGDVFTDLRMGYLRGPNQEADLKFAHSVSHSVLVGGFVQDSWSILDRVTLNVGVRLDAQTLTGTGDQVALSLPGEWSPRLGLIWDPTQAGRAKLYASYARYYENVPLDLAYRGFGTEASLAGELQPASGQCNPRSATTAECVSADRRLHGVNVPPNTDWLINQAPTREAVDPEIRPPSVDEWVAGVEFEVLPNTRASVAFTHRAIVDWVEDMGADGNGLFIGNPGQGIGSNFPFARRVYNAFVVSVDKRFADLWLAQVSYTYQNLTGNVSGLYREQTGQLDPNILSDFDIQRLLVNREGPLKGDIRHTLKAFLAKEFVVGASVGLVLGAGYTGASGAPIDFLGANGVPGYGTGEVFVFPRGSVGRLPWRHSIDLRGGLSFRFSASTVLGVSVDVFNLFNFQQVTSLDENYTYYPVGVAPVPNGNPSTDRSKIVRDSTGQPLAPGQINPDFLRPTAYQPVRQVRFQARVDF